MSLEKREKNINGRVYTLLTPPVRQAMPICTNLATLLGPVIGSLGSDVKAGGMLKFASALQGVDPASLDSLFMRAIEVAKLTHEGIPITDEVSFERHFGQHPGDVYQVCAWALWECAKDFFPQLDALRQMTQQAMAGVSQSPSAGQ